TSNNAIDAELENITNEFADLVKNGNQWIGALDDENTSDSLTVNEDQMELSVFVDELDTRDLKYNECGKERPKVVSMIFSNLILFLVVVPLEFFVFHMSLSSGLILPLLASTCNVLVRWKSIKTYIEAKKDYKKINASVQVLGKSKRLYAQLLFLRNRINELVESKNRNKRQIDNLKRKFIRVFELEMEEKYREVGIDEKIEIQSATITANSINLLSLELKSDGQKKKGD
ncbi:MAG: hypothetical protein K2I70_03380, partial [Bacilli bacterium]|nr:hypothetical protein [Bacilli bacterium]